MSNTVEAEVIRKLRERAARGELNGIDVSYHVTGGAPGEQLVDEEIQLSGGGPAHARVRAGAAAMQEASVNIPAPEMKDLLLEISEGADELIPLSEARFIPDSIVGRISVKVDGQEASFFFLPDQEQAKQHGKALLQKAARAVGTLQRLQERILHR